MMRWQKMALWVLRRVGLSGKTKCAICVVAEFQNILCGGKKLKHEALGCRVGKKSAVKFICLPIASIIVCSFNGCCVGLYACL